MELRGFGFGGSRRMAGTTFLGRLRRDARGNTIAIMAVALIPLTAMIGSGVDMTRAYMARNRLRQACDAGALAGRKLLTGTTVSDAVRNEATKYFAFNFPQGQFQTAAYTLAITAPSSGTLQVATTTTIPTTLMKMFGYNNLELSATCRATQDFVNTDIMLVFDLSGSMNCAPGVAGNCGNTNQTNSKLDALKAAAISLYDTLEPAQTQLANANLRLRYGFVNYSSAVNVGAAVYAEDTGYFVSQWTYQSRHHAVDDSSLNETQCRNQNGSYSTEWAWSRREGWYQVSNCRYPVNYHTGTYLFRPVTVDVTQYLAGQTPNIPAQRDRTSAWRGCIEEADTDNVGIDGGTATYAPTGANDLNVDLIPSSDATRWRPYWPEMEYRRSSATSGSAAADYCPAAARRLANYHNNRSGFVDYVNGLAAIGGTYHDLGMIWGARFISPDGIFRANPVDTNDNTVADNAKSIRGFSVKKYLIFMTDGQMAPTMEVYSTYGVEELDRRVTGTSNNQDDRHLQRFRMACNAAKAKGIDVWVIAFDTTLTTDMQNCASKPEQAASLNDRAALIQKFQEIGTRIGSLRLSQ